MTSAVAAAIIKTHHDRVHESDCIRTVICFRRVTFVSALGIWCLIYRPFPFMYSKAVIVTYEAHIVRHLTG